MRSVPALAILFAAALAACTGPRGPAGSAGATCSVHALDGGAQMISCSDGTSVTVQNAKPTAACTITTPDGGGARTITCADGTSVTVQNGDAGTSCSVGVSDAGLKVVTCSDGTVQTVSPDPIPPTNVLATTDALPGLVVKIVSLAGGSDENGTFEIGDTVAATFTVRTSAGVDLPLASLNRIGIWIAGPTSGYQRVLPAARDQLTFADVATRSTRNPDGSYTYKFASPLPGTYGAPLYDTTKFTDGELTGQPLQHGTYTLALSAFRTYQIGVTSAPDVGSDTRDFLLGASATTLEPREVVALGNCNSCHVTLQAHGGVYRDTKLCVTCHTAGAEDDGSTDANDATPVTIQFNVLIHKIHDGGHLPSVLGIGTNADGTRNYTATPKPYVVGGAHPDDFSNEQFSAWPSLSFPMPRAKGYSALTPTQQATDDTSRSGVVACGKCHGDPDGAGPLPAPAQGGFAFAHQSRTVCGSCHDDVDWTKPYKRSTDTGMAAQLDDSKCLTCHPSTGAAVG
ncbi:MAG TPA: hypothetical protein VMT47_13420, partial [Polyangia bacterium]|nr:hypothetical protein [Polyangia bacterium]